VGRVVTLPPPPLKLFQGLVSLSPLASPPNSCHRRDPTVAARGVQDVIVVGRNFRGTTCTRKGTRGPPVLQVCVCSLGVPSGGPELDSGVVLSLFHVVPLYAPGLPPPLHSASWTTSNSAGGSCTWCVPLAVSFGCSCSGSCS
jgi:hypothetical protein